MSWLVANLLSKQYEGQSVPALRNVSFSLEQGKILGILGASGCGKTTLLQLLAGLLEPDSGHISLDGAPVAGPTHRLVPGHEQIRILKQTIALSPNMRVSENLRYFIMKWPKKRQDARVAELLDLCRLQDLSWKWPRELSGGQQQRLALARALADKPSLLLLDEPFSHLDMGLKQALQAEIADLVRESGTTAVWVTHDPQEAMAVADELAILERGEIKQYGTPLQVYRHPRNYEIAQLFGPTLVATGLLLKEAFLHLPIAWVPERRYLIREWDWSILPWQEDQPPFVVKRLAAMPGYWRLTLVHDILGTITANIVELPPNIKTESKMSLTPLLSRLVTVFSAV